MEDKDTLEPVKSGVAGFCITGKERAVFRPSERKSMLGLDVLANAKRGGSKVDDGLKVPKEVTSVVSSIDEEEKSEFSRLVEEESDMVNGARNTNRRYRETAASENSNPGFEDEEDDW